MPTTAIGVLGNGTRVGWSSASPQSYTTVASVLEVTIPKIVADEIDKTTHSTGGFYRSFRGLKRVENVTLMLLGDHKSSRTASHAALRNLQRDGDTVWFRFEIPLDRNLATSQCFALIAQFYVKSWGPAAPIADKQTIEVVLGFDGDDVEFQEPTAFTLTA